MAADTESVNVLIVDDCAIMLRIVRSLLKQIGFNSTDEFTEGGQALQMMKMKKYGLAISDWNMEPITGVQLLRLTRAEDDLKLTSFITVTAESKAENVSKAKSAGVSNYIVKPFNGATLKGKIAGVLGQFQ